MTDIAGRNRQAAYWLVLLAVWAALASTAATNILLGAGLAVTLVAHRRLLFPKPLIAPLLCFVAWTLIATAASADPGAAWPQIKKFYVFLTLPLLYTVLRGAEDVKRLFLGWILVGFGSALWSFVEFFQKYRATLERGQDFYMSYIGDRTSGFMSMWMTFSAQEMTVLAVLLAGLLSGWMGEHRLALWTIAAIVAIAIVICMTRGVWLGSGLATLYLVSAWRPKLLLFIPVFLPIAWFVSPTSVRERAISIYKPHGERDSNQHRVVTARTGVAMIRSNPVFGLGPEMPGREFANYLPADLKQQPLPEGYYRHLHNVYLQYAAERGLVALGAFLWLVSVTILRCIRSARQGSLAGAAISHAVIAVLIGLLAEGFFEYNLGDSEVLSMFLGVVACAFVGESKLA